MSARNATLEPNTLIDLTDLPALFETIADAPLITEPLTQREEGYAQAVRDQLGSLVLIAETFLRDQALQPVRPPSGNPLRRTVYAFVDHLQKNLASLSPDKELGLATEVEEGLEI